MVRLLCKCLAWVWLLLLVHKHPIHALGGCIERERRGLLEFKAFLMLNNEDPDLLLPSWVDDESSNCCEWERVLINFSLGGWCFGVLKEGYEVNFWKAIKKRWEAFKSKVCFIVRNGRVKFWLDDW